MPRDDGPAPGDDPLRLYLDDIGRHDLLDRAGEARLGAAVAAGAEAAARLAAAEAGTVTLTRRERRQLCEAVRSGEAAQVAFVEANLRLVVSIAKRYQHTGVSLADLISEGNLGLLHAVTKFDWRKGFKFSTYATWWIRQAITRGVANTGRTIRMPVHAEALLRAHDRTRVRLVAELGREPGLDEIAAELSTSAAHISDMLASARVVASTDEPLGDDSDASYADLFADSGVDVEGEALAGAARAAVGDALAALDERERRILELRFGLDSGEARTLDQVAAAFDLTRERIRQIESKALSKLRHSPAVAALDGLAS